MEPDGIVKLQALLEKFITISVGFAFIALVIMLFYGGIKYLVSGGDAKSIASASGTITWAILGMIFLIVIWLVLRLISSITGVPVTEFCLGFKPYCAF